MISPNAALWLQRSMTMFGSRWLIQQTQLLSGVFGLYSLAEGLEPNRVYHQQSQNSAFSLANLRK
jgi:hypothetical protein